MQPELKAYFATKTVQVNAALRRYLPGGNALIAKAMRYSIFAGGKRLRPLLVIAGAELCGGREKDVLPAACALEYIHTYSLIHDDLPAMDNDDLRRGMPTSHKKFGEACAILAGDALLTEAFRLVTLSTASGKCVAQAAGILSEAAGYEGMIGGQIKDTIETGRWQAQGKRIAAKKLKEIHLLKTAALIRASLLVGAALAGGTKKQMAALDRYGRAIGLAFQVADDILDVTADKKLLGKRGSDRENNKLTYVSLYGLEQAKSIARGLVADAKKELKIFGSGAVVLSQLADYIIERNY